MAHEEVRPGTVVPSEAGEPGIAGPGREELTADLDPAPEAAGRTGPSTGLLSFYDRLRAKILEAVERRAGRLPEDAVKALLLVPDLFVLLVRLTLDRRVPARTRALIGGSLAYFLLPYDLLPVTLLGPIGYLDELVLAVAVLAQVWSGDLEPYARRHWSGPEDVRIAVGDVVRACHALLAPETYERLKRAAARRGIPIEDEPPAAGRASGPAAPPRD
jgi:uncharacterized membrane protein YkvA (DUF1232 family)